MVDIRAKYGTKNTKKADFLHSSGYAKAQSGKNIGSATSSASFATRTAIENQRKYVQKYRNSKILQNARAFERVKSYTPRAEKPTTTVRGRGSLTKPQKPVDNSSRPCYNRNIGRPYGGISSDG